MTVRLVHVVSGDLMAGAEAMVEQLCLKQQERGNISIEVVLFNDGILAMRLRSYGLSVRIFDECRTSFRDTVSALRAHFRQSKPNIVHTHGTKENIAGALASVGQRHCIGVRTVHGQEEYPPTIRQVKRRAVAILDALVGRFLQDCIVPVAPDTARSLPAILNRQRTFVIRNGIDPDKIRAGVALVPGLASRGRHRIVFIGRLASVKQVHLIIEAVERLEISYPSRFELEIVGEGPLREKLETFAADRQAEIIFRGFQRDSRSLLAGATVLVLASKHEGLPMVVLESLCLGVPIVAPAVGAIPQIIGPADGKLVDVAETDSLAEAIASVAFNRETYDPRLPECCDASTMERAYFKLYADLLKGVEGEADCAGG